jgi:plastocyanin
MKKINSVLFQKVATLVVTGLLAVFVDVSQAATMTVTCVGDSFSPSAITINVGDTVVWAGLANASSAGQEMETSAPSRVVRIHSPQPAHFPMNAQSMWHVAIWSAP